MSTVKAVAMKTGTEPSSTDSLGFGETIGIYLHLPYCIQKCPYCDFNSYGIGRAAKPGSTDESSMPEGRYMKALCREVSAAASRPEWQNRSVHSIFFGGGTPTLFAPESFRIILGELRNAFSFAPDIEITIEANPGTIHEPLADVRLAAFREVGISRISLGAQSFSEKKLAFLGRIHSPKDTLDAVANIKRAGFSNFNLDLIYGVAGESITDWEADLAHALALEPKHLSAYTLMIEPGTEFARRHRKGDLPLADDDIVAEQYAVTRRILRDSGFEPYEVSNAARPGYECRHNLGYWLGEDYLALGAGAYGFAWDRSAAPHAPSGVRYTNLPGPNDYMDRIEERGDARHLEERLSTTAAETEFLLLRLRLAQGLDLELYRTIFGYTFTDRFRAPLDRLSDNGLIMLSGSQLKITDTGMMVANEVITELLLELPNEATRPLQDS